MARLERISYPLVLILLVIFACGEVAQFAWSTHDLRQETRQFVASAKANTSMESYLKYLAERSHGAIVYEDFNSDIVGGFRSSLKATQSSNSAGWVVLTRYGPDRYSAESNSAAIQEISRIADLGQTASRYPYLGLGLICGLALAAFLRPSSIYIGIPVAAAAVSAYRFFKACPTCIEPNVVGLPISLIALIAYTGLTLILIRAKPSRLLIRSVGWSAMFALGLQLYLGIAYGWACIPCALVALLNATLAYWALKDCGQLSDLLGEPFRTKLMIAAIATVCFGGLAYATPSQQSDAGRFQRNTYAPAAFPGRNAVDLHFGHAPGCREIVALAVADCEPCHDARMFFGRRQDITVRFVTLVTGASDPRLEGTAPYPTGMVRGTPTFLFVDEGGTIRQEIVGWSGDKVWQEALVLRLKTFIAGAHPGKAHLEGK